MNLLQKIKKAFLSPIQSIVILAGYNNSFSQTWEDLILKHLINKKKGFYIDLGANHPKHYNNTYYFYNQWWNGINIEPNKQLIRKFQLIRPRDINLQLAWWIGKELTFFVFNPNTLSTCDIDTADRYKQLGHAMVDSYSVPVMGLASIIEQYAGDIIIDILSVDVEGYDLAILETNNWEKYRPRFIILETLEYSNNESGKKTNNLYDPKLESWGYEIVADTYINTIYKDKNYLVWKN